MSKITAEIRQTFLEFFKRKGHKVLASSSLVPDNDSTLLFTNAGMNQFKNVFLNLDQCKYHRVATSQRCLRAGGKHNDLENVGYTTRHHTFFEMLGNFSFGDYFKHDAIQFAWELLTDKQWFNLQKDKIWVTVHVTDVESYNIWANIIGMPPERIIRIGDNKSNPCESDNFWQMSDVGPCGPCSEIYYDQGENIYGGPPGSLESNGDRYIEIWNLVFMQFNRQINGSLLPLAKPSVDTGMGLERIASILQHVDSNYDTDLFKGLILAAANIIGLNDFNNKSLRVIADHIRSCAFLISDGITPSSEGRGYVLRRIIRRAIRHGSMIGAKGSFFYKLVGPLIEVMGNTASIINQQRKTVETILRCEEEQFTRTLKRGLTMLNEELDKLKGNTLDGKFAFLLHDTYGFPLDLTSDICRERNICIDELSFKRSMETQRERARISGNYNSNYKSLQFLSTNFVGYEYLIYHGNIAALLRKNQLVDVIYPGEEATIILDKTPFYGEHDGQVGDCGELKANSGIFKVINTKKYNEVFIHLGYLKHGKLKLGAHVTAIVDSEHRKRICLNHSATHLLYASLLQVLGEHVMQKSMFINDQHLQFDFSHHAAMTPKQVRQVEKIVNKQIRNNILIQAESIKLHNARVKKPLVLPDKKCEEHARVLSIGDFSTELCCGMHANRTGDIGLFHIISESSVTKGIRRIEAITGEAALDFLYQQSDLLHSIIKLFNGNNQTIIDKLQTLQKRAQQLESISKNQKNI